MASFDQIMKNRTPRKRRAPQQKPQPRQQYHPFIEAWLSAGGKLKPLPQPIRFSLQLPFWSVATVAIAAFFVVALSARIFGGWDGLKKLTVWVLALSILLGFGMAIYYHIQGETRGSLYPFSADDGRQWFWLRFTIASTGVAGVWTFIRWLRDPVFYPEAAKSYYMGQSLNNQRRIREDLSDIRSRLDE